LWPGLLAWLGRAQDPRDQNRITYLREFLPGMGLMLLLLKASSRRQVGFELDSPEALKDLNALSGCSQETMAHPGTLGHFLGHVPTESLWELRRRMVHRLIRMKALECARLSGYFLIAIDGTGQYTFRERHCERCLEQKHHDKTLYHHNVLAAKLVTPDGLAFSVAHEFNEYADPTPASPHWAPAPSVPRLAQPRPVGPPVVPHDCGPSLTVDASGADGYIASTARLATRGS
jgi:hypothetical protein